MTGFYFIYVFGTQPKSFPLPKTVYLIYHTNRNQTTYFRKDYDMHYSKKMFPLCITLSVGIIISGISYTPSANAEIKTASSPDNLSSISRVVSNVSGDVIHYDYVDKYGNSIDLSSASDNTGDKISLKKHGNLLSSYNLNDYGLNTSIKDQGYSGACWSFAAVKAMESNSILNGLLTLDTADFSENHLAWYTYHPSNDTSDLLYNEGYSISSFPGSSSKNSTIVYDNGGNALMAVGTLASWKGAELESNFPFNADTQSEYESMASTMSSKDSSLCYSSYAHLQQANCYDDSSIEEIQQAILETGALDISIYYTDSGFEYGTDGNHVKDGVSYYQTEYSIPDIAKVAANHCVTIVGWDDNYSKNNFQSTPAGDGAWLIANSYGSSFNDGGYFWLSYYEPSITDVYSFEIEAADNYDYNYQYDALGWSDGLCFNSQDITGANVFTADSSANQTLNAVSFYTLSDDQSYTVSIYTDLTGSTPDTGTLVNQCTITGTENYSGYHTVSLDTPCEIKAGSKFAVAVTYHHKDGSKTDASLPIESSSWNQSGLSATYTSSPGQSFIFSKDTWYDCTSDYVIAASGICNNICIKAFTSNNNITLSPTGITLGKGESYKLSAKLSGDFSDDTVTYTSSDKSIVTVNSAGKATAVGVGTATVTGALNDGSISTITVTVKKAPTYIKTVPSNSKTVKKGKTFRIKTKLSAGSASQKITYTSSNKKVAKVNSTGRVTAKKKGKATITVKTYNNKKAVIKVTVK